MLYSDMRRMRGIYSDMRRMRGFYSDMIMTTIISSVFNGARAYRIIGILHESVNSQQSEFWLALRVVDQVEVH